MGIESDQLVYDYLSRVGDEAQQRQLPSGDRMRLVSTLRNEIERQRGKSVTDSPAAVRRILGRLGPPDAVVAAASGGAGRTAAEPEEPWAAVPEQRSEEPVLTAQEPAFPEQRATPPPPSFGEPDWWRIGMGPMDVAGTERGILAGIEVPEMLEPPPKDEDDEDDEDDEGEDGEDDGSGKKTADGALLRRLRRPFGIGTKRAGVRKVFAKKAVAKKAVAKTGGKAGVKPGEAVGGKAGAKARGFSNPFLLLAAALLVVGAVAGSWLALGGGWLLAYASRTLSRAEAKWAVFGLPGVSAAGGLIWLWGRIDGRWGAPVPDDGMADALSGIWPVVLRTAAVTSALYLIWRARRK
ncbi:hypothetical protein ACFYYH_33665 [Streptomyces sp. NPDC002018]|uniref:hypothetical protein n=1 Tax=Streptomyces sp. NPDC002018 TaxID=3364629 RepID=UPI0036BCB880